MYRPCRTPVKYRFVHIHSIYDIPTLTAMHQSLCLTPGPLPHGASAATGAHAHFLSSYLLSDHCVVLPSVYLMSCHAKKKHAQTPVSLECNVVTA